MQSTPLRFTTDNTRFQARFEAALQGLKQNMRLLPHWERPVLHEGAEYDGIWLECGPHESAIYGAIDPQAAIDGHRIFFAHQHQDGYLPCYFRGSKIGSAQVQTVVPLAATALDVFRLTGDRNFLEEAYVACSRYDAWFRKYRNTRGTGLAEVFCEFDTGHDNSPRVHGLPRECPNDDARQCPEADGLPYLAPDLSATVHGGRMALSRMAKLLGRTAEMERWKRSAIQIAQAIFEHCYDEASLCFYDRDTHGNFVRVRGDVLLRTMSELVFPIAVPEEIYDSNVVNPNRFWTPFPFPSVSADDPAFVRDLPPNSWGGAAQALQALRAPRLFEAHGTMPDLAHLMRQWLRALIAADDFRQQINPWTGEMLPGGSGYSPAMLVMLDFTSRLHGIQRYSSSIEWGCELPPGATASRFELENCRLEIEGETSRLFVDDAEILRVEGVCRITFLPNGRRFLANSVRNAEQRIRVTGPSGATTEYRLAANESVPVG